MDDVELEQLDRERAARAQSIANRDSAHRAAERQARERETERAGAIVRLRAHTRDDRDDLDGPDADTAEARAEILDERDGGSWCELCGCWANEEHVDGRRHAAALRECALSWASASDGGSADL